MSESSFDFLNNRGIEEISWRYQEISSTKYTQKKF